MSRDEARVVDMLTFARRALRHLGRTSESDFASDALLQDAVIRCVLVVGEAANGVSPGFREEHPEVPWSDICGMRNRLVHDYLGVDLGLVRDVVAHRLPALVVALEPLAAPDGYDSVPDEWEFL